MPGKDRQPSSPFWLPSTRSTSGLIRATRCAGSLPPEQSITKSRLDTPTCTAAKPTPGAEYIVSNILLTSLSRSPSNSVTGLAGSSSTGAGHLTISNKAMMNSQTPHEKTTLVEALQVIVTKQPQPC